MERRRYDVVVIGAGATGCAVARELARYELSVCLLEKEEDVCSGTSKANSAIVHAGYDAQPGSMKARMNVEGNRRMAELSGELDFEYRQNGSLVLCFSEEDRPKLEELRRRGIENGVPGLRVLNGAEARAMEPMLTDAVTAALYAPTGGIVCPFGLTAALAENACENGVEFCFGARVNRIGKRGEAESQGPGNLKTPESRRELGNLETLESRREPGKPVKPAERRNQSGGFLICGETTGRGGSGPAGFLVEADYVVNAAGVYADELHNMVSGKKMQITPRKGDYCLLDKTAGGHVARTIFQLPGLLGKGVLVTPTVHGNLLVGPTASDVEDKEQTGTTAEELAFLKGRAAKGVREIPWGSTITSFSGLRAHEAGDDFVIGEAPGAPGFFDAAGIESPGLTCAPAIGAFVAGLVAAKAGAARRRDFKGGRKGIVRAASLPPAEREKLIEKEPVYGSIVCRCEQISEGEILEAVRRRPGAVSMDGIKRRVRAGMGRCQAGFCSPRAAEILARETGLPLEEICKNRRGSGIVTGDMRRAPEGGCGENMKTMFETERERLLAGTDLFVLDMDGTFYLGDTLLPGALDFLRRAEERGKKWMFFTNNSSKSTRLYVEKLARMGCLIERNQIMTSGDVMIEYLKSNYPGKTVYLVGTPALEEAFLEGGVAIAKESPDLVVVGFDVTLTYEKLERACAFIRSGAPFLATHLDINCPTEEGFIPDCGAICAAISLSTGKEPKYVGKPFRETVDMILKLTGVERERVAFVGDRLYTDVATGVKNGAKGILVLTGETKLPDVAASEVLPDAVFDSLGEMARFLGKGPAI